MRLSTHTWMRPEPLEITCERAHRLGFSSIELVGEPDFYKVDNVRKLLRKYSLACWGTVTATHGTRDLIAANEQQRNDTIAYMKSVVAMSADLGGSIVTVVPSRVGKLYPQSTPENEWNWAVAGLREVCAYAQDRGIKIAIEPLNRYETYFINRTAQALKLIEDTGYDCCGIAFDPFHLNIEETDLFAAIYACKGRIFDVHLGDNNRLAPGDGNIDWKRFMACLREVGYDGDVVNEAVPPIDRTPASSYATTGGQLETGELDGSVDQAMVQFLRDHGSDATSNRYYTSVLQKCADTILPLIAECSTGG